MELLEKKKRAAIIAVSIYLQNADNNKNEEICCKWSKMGMNRNMNEREFLFRQGKTVGVRIF